MNRHFILFYFLILFSIQLNADFAIAQNKKPASFESVSGKIADVESINFDQEVVYLPCPTVPVRSINSICSEDDLNVKVATVAKNAKENNLTYYYSVSGGKIIGEGANVIWNFSKMKPGKYTITIGVGGGGIIRGKILTKTIELEECPICDPDCECPILSISTPTEKVKAGDAFIVTSSVGGFEEETMTYNWKISGGTIVSGQGTSQIIVKTNDADKNIKVTLELGGLCESCPPISAEEVVPVFRKK